MVCLDIGSCEVLTPLEQIIKFLTAVDTRLKTLDKEHFLEAMCAIATEDAVLLKMHRGLEVICSANDDSE